ncbi:hypothetical protein BHE74_00004513 [Ensete ventricosum]|nr:hypothetical protein BHE74_00004513 [Ensete ventricosum]RZR83000.1 hypothetical protein BHM03_00009542 [Ensete ventricosum]
MVPKTEGASRHMHLILEKHLTEELRGRSSMHASNFTSEESLGHHHMRVMYYRGGIPSVSTRELVGEHRGVEASGQRSEEATMSLERLGTQNQASVRMEVDSKECHGTAKADLPIVKGRRCEATDSSAMGIATTWYHRDETSIESLISCSHGGRPLIVKGA